MLRQDLVLGNGAAAKKGKFISVKYLGASSNIMKHKEKQLILFFCSIEGTLATGTDEQGKAFDSTVSAGVGIGIESVHSLHGMRKKTSLSLHLICCRSLASLISHSCWETRSVLLVS